MSDFSRPILIAEVACAHQGRVDHLFDLSRSALQAGFKAIKFQLMNASSHMSTRHELYPLIQTLEIPQEAWTDLFKWIRSNYPHVTLIADIYDPASLQLAVRLCPDIVKIHAADLGNLDLVTDIARLNIPLLLGTGGSSTDEITRSISLIRSFSNAPLCLMFGFQGYPTQLADFGLPLINQLKNKFNLPIGFLDHIDATHHLATSIPLLAFAHGASIVEKHITLSRDLCPVDAESSLEPSQFPTLLSAFHDYQLMLSATSFDEQQLSPSQTKYRNLMKKRCVFSRDVPHGTLISKDIVAFKRANAGIFADEVASILGKSTAYNRQLDDPILLDELV